MRRYEYFLSGVSSSHFLDRSCRSHYSFASKPRRLPERNRMTIAIGFVCTDVVVLTADRQEMRGIHKVEVHKILMRKSHQAGLAFSVAGAGDGELIKQFVDELADALSASPSGTWPNIKAAVQAATKDMFDRNLAPLSQAKQDQITPSFLIAASIQGRANLFAAAPVQQYRRIQSRNHAIGIGRFAA